MDWRNAAWDGKEWRKNERRRKRRGIQGCQYRIAEDDTEVKYELKVNKYTKTDEALSSGLGFATMGCVGYGAYCFSKKRQKR